jgi:hypothetical protein
MSAGGPASCEACQAELKKAQAEGWVLKPYVPKPAPDPLAHLYEEKSQKKSA